MPAVQHPSQLDKSVPNRLDPCPADERVVEWTPDELYAPGAKSGSEGEVVGDDGITRQKCGGGHRVIRKRIGGGG